MTYRLIKGFNPHGLAQNKTSPLNLSPGLRLEFYVFWGFNNRRLNHIGKFLNCQSGTSTITRKNQLRINVFSLLKPFPVLILYGQSCDDIPCNFANHMPRFFSPAYGFQILTQM